MDVWNMKFISSVDQDILFQVLTINFCSSLFNRNYERNIFDDFSMIMWSLFWFVYFYSMSSVYFKNLVNKTSVFIQTS